ncbi:MAG: GGDEF domain-containing protein [Kutzneria sp.]|nr:GGDEF domain-containing protein [Kutzneria sp.]
MGPASSGQPRFTAIDSAAGNLVDLHEKLADLLASLGQWREAYTHLRSALDLVCRGNGQAAPVPDQLRREVDRLCREHVEAHEQSIRDSLTASYNRRYLDQRLVALLSEQPVGTYGLAVALVDLDWFKQVNDTHGHLIGDRVLRQVADLLGADLPATAFCARYGGEEFVLVLPDTGAKEAVSLAEAARARVEQHDWSAIAAGLRVTASIGVAHGTACNGMASGAVGDATRQLLRADRLLYCAKQSGRNAVAYRDGTRVRLAGPAGNRRAVAEAHITECY